MLRIISLARGVGNEAFVLAVGGQPQTYHSEKHFSLGELCVLKLLKLLNDISDGSLVVIDELEMALHPKAQIKLLELLKQQVALKNLTVIFSTHSVSLLKSIDRKSIIYLEPQDDGSTKVITGCFPTYAIGNIASDEETLPDMVVYVEDIMARDVLMGMFDMFAGERYQDPTMRPSIKAVPVGGFKEVVSFVDRNRAVLPPQVRQKALLDADVSTETVAQWRQGNKHSELAKFQRVEANLDYLPFTPEVGMMNYVSDNLLAFQAELRVRCADNQLRIEDICNSYDKNLTGSALRKAAKSAIDSLIKLLEGRVQYTSDQARDRLCGVFAKQAWTQYRADFLRIFGSMLQ
jgi:hypothetical protein